MLSASAELIPEVNAPLPLAIPARPAPVPLAVPPTFAIGPPTKPETIPKKAARMVPTAPAAESCIEI